MGDGDNLPIHTRRMGVRLLYGSCTALVRLLYGFKSMWAGDLGCAVFVVAGKLIFREIFSFSGFILSIRRGFGRG